MPEKQAKLIVHPVVRQAVKIMSAKLCISMKEFTDRALVDKIRTLIRETPDLVVHNYILAWEKEQRAKREAEVGKEVK